MGSMDGVIKIPTTDMSHEEWLNVRRESIGGSDAAAIVGMNDHVSPYSLWCNKTKRTLDAPDNEAMRIGRDLEDYVARRWCEQTQKRAKRINAILKREEYPFAHANVDRWVVGENAGLECKTTSILRLKDFKNGEYPQNYYAQCVHYMAITGAERWYLAVLVLGKGFYHFTIERDCAEIEALMGAEKDFFELVKTDTPPEIDGSQATTDAINAIYGKSRFAEAVDLFGSEQLIEKYLSAKRLKSEVQKQIDELENRLKDQLKDAEIGTVGKYVASWKQQTRTCFDLKRFSDEHPELDLGPYYKQSSFRKFSIKESEPQ